MLIAKAVVSLAAVATVLGGALADLVIPAAGAKQHMFNPHWPPHARFHNGQTILLGVFLGLFSLGLLWYPGGEQQVQFHLAVIVVALYWLSIPGASLFPMTRWTDPQFPEVRLILRMPPQLLIVCCILALLIVSEVLSFL